MLLIFIILYYPSKILLKLIKLWYLPSDFAQNLTLVFLKFWLHKIVVKFWLSQNSAFLWVLLYFMDSSSAATFGHVSQIHLHQYRHTRQVFYPLHYSWHSPFINNNNIFINLYKLYTFLTNHKNDTIRRIVDFLYTT